MNEFTVKLYIKRHYKLELLRYPHLYFQGLVQTYKVK